MADFIKVAAAHAKRALVTQDIHIQHSVVLEVLAGLLGYHTFAALKTEESDESLDRHLDDADFLILNEDLGLQRSVQLCDSAVTVVEECMTALVRRTPMWVFRSVNCYFAGLGRLAVHAKLHDPPFKNTSSPMTQFMKSVKTAHIPIANGPVSFTESVWTARTHWTLVCEAQTFPDNGKHVAASSVVVTLTFRKAGRAGLILLSDDDKGVPVEPFKASLQCSRLDRLVMLGDGECCRPFVGFFVDLNTRKVLGASISTTASDVLLEVVADASKKVLPQLTSSEIVQNRPHVTVDIDDRIWSVELNESVSAMLFNTDWCRVVTPNGRVESLRNSLLRLLDIIEHEDVDCAFRSLESVKAQFALVIQVYNSTLERLEPYKRAIRRPRLIR